MTRQAILVIGMHRSGTSALARVINLHGVSLGRDLPEAAFDNEAGFWENQPVVRLHERILAHLGSSWDDPRPLPLGWLEDVERCGYVDELLAVIEAEFGDASVWAIKDPRICRLLPLWLKTLERLRIEPKLLFSLRHPGEVVGSLMRRNGLSPAAASMLWVGHLAEPLPLSRGSARCVVEYDLLLANWRGCMRAIGDTLGLEWPVPSAQAAEEVDAHLRGDLRHHHASHAVDMLPSPWRDALLQIHSCGVALAQALGSWLELEASVDAFNSRLDFSAPLLPELDAKSLRDQRAAQVAELLQDRDAYRAEAERLFKESAASREEALAASKEAFAAKEQALAAAGEAQAAKFAAAEAQQETAGARLEMAEARKQLDAARKEVQRIREEALMHEESALQHEALALEHEASARLDENERREAAKLRRQVARAEQLLIAARGELAKRKARILVLERSSQELDRIMASRSWNLTRPMRVFMRLLRSHGRVGEADRAKLRQWLGRAPTSTVRAPTSIVSPQAPESGGSELPSKRTVPEVLRAPQAEGKRDVFVWSVIDWHFRIQRPQHLARELAAKGHRVFYISCQFIDQEAPAFSVEPLDDDMRLFRIQLALAGSPAIYHAVPTPDDRRQLTGGIGKLLAWAGSRSCLSLVEHPYWMEIANVLPNVRTVYDCMDHHGGFADNTPDVLARESELMRTADLLVVTSEWLYKEAGRFNPHTVTVRNGCEYGHFATPVEPCFRDEQGRKVIGYYGAIAEWFDLELLEAVAQRFSDCLVLMVGADTAGAREHLKHLANVRFVGEVRYTELPFYLSGFDVCLLPFQVIPLTLATNPVKVYEYLSAGKEVVAVDLPEMSQFAGLVRTADTVEGFIAEVAAALEAQPDGQVVERRRQFAAGQTWAHRADHLVQAVAALPEPTVSVIVVTYNNLDLTRGCLSSLDLHSDYRNLDIIVVDNASSDDTPAFLREWAAAGVGRRIVLNDDNRGFAAANNQGLELATGDYLVMLNNDTYVTPGWVATLVGHLRRSPRIGMLGPVTNNIGNEARIDISYDNMDEMLVVARDYTAKHAGALTSLRTAAFFCVMMRREVYEKVGALDEVFGIGFFEDDDYCRRVEQAGWTIACAEDVFVHHNLSASFNKLKQSKRQALFEQNKAIYETKWGPWEPHKYRGA